MTNEHVLDQASLDAILVESSALMKRGLQLVAHYRDVRDGATLQDAIACFDAAGRLRENLPLDDHAVFRYDLAACYLNRAEALLLSDETAALRRAVAALDDGLCWLETLPLGDDPRYVRRLAVAQQNRGLALLRLQPARQDGTRDLRGAIATLRRRDVRMPDDRDQLLATACVNLAGHLARHTASAEAESNARLALDLQRTAETTFESAAGIALQARHVLCRRLASGDTRSHCADATDLAEEALSIIAAWEQRGVETFRPLACDFFAFGAGAYASYQPQFLEEFLAEWLDASRTSPGFVTAPAIVQAAVRARELAAVHRLPAIRFTAAPGLALSARSL